jgi:hypothetical protein
LNARSKSKTQPYKSNAKAGLFSLAFFYWFEFGFSRQQVFERKWRQVFLLCFFDLCVVALHEVCSADDSDRTVLVEVA